MDACLDQLVEWVQHWKLAIVEPNIVGDNDVLKPRNEDTVSFVGCTVAHHDTRS